jgi:hypothetical protein
MKYFLIALLVSSCMISANAQKRKAADSGNDSKTPLEKLDVSGLKCRRVGLA